MTNDHPLRRLLARCCSDDTMRRVVDPTLADMRIERGRPAWLGYLALTRALAVHAAVSLPDRARRVWHDDERSIPRAAAACLATAFVAALPFVLVPMLGDFRNRMAVDVSAGILPRGARTLSMFLLLLPQALGVTLAPALLVALPLALRRGRASARQTRRVLGLAAISCIAMGVLINWGAPTANQRYRVVISGNPRLERGENETNLRRLRTRMESLKHNTTADPAVLERARRWLEYRYQLRLALIASPLPLAVLGLGIAATHAARRRPWAIGALTMIGYVVVLFAADGRARSVIRMTNVPPALLAWLPTIALSALAFLIWRATRTTAAAATP